jgi:hypothetical protein
MLVDFRCSIYDTKPYVSRKISPGSQPGLELGSIQTIWKRVRFAQSWGTFRNWNVVLRGDVTKWPVRLVSRVSVIKARQGPDPLSGFLFSVTGVCHSSLQLRTYRLIAPRRRA